MTGQLSTAVRRPALPAASPSPLRRPSLYSQRREKRRKRTKAQHADRFLEGRTRQATADHRSIFKTSADSKQCLKETAKALGKDWTSGQISMAVSDSRRTMTTHLQQPTGNHFRTKCLPGRHDEYSGIPVLCFVFLCPVVVV